MKHLNTYLEIHLQDKLSRIPRVMVLLTSLD